MHQKQTQQICSNDMAQTCLIYNCDPTKLRFIMRINYAEKELGWKKPQLAGARAVSNKLLRDLV